MQCDILDGILEQRKNLSGETQIKSGNLGISKAPLFWQKNTWLCEMLTVEETRQRVYGNFLYCPCNFL